jgi:hypothetical protein
MPAARYLDVPAEAELIKTLMRGILPAIWAEPAELLGSVERKKFTAPGEVRQKGPNSERAKKIVCPASKTGPAVITHPPLDRGDTKSVENTAQSEWLAGTDDHGLLLRGAGRALNMRAVC